MKKITPENPYTTTYDLNNCDKEPIHIIQTVQSFAAILAVDIADLSVSQVSTNLFDYLHLTPDAAIGKSIDEIFSGYISQSLKQGIELADFSEINPILVPISDQILEPIILVSHIHEDKIIIEIEKVSKVENNLNFLNKIDNAIQQIQKVKVSAKLFQVVAKEVKNISGYDRVMLYKFDNNYNGEVIAEAKEESLEPFLGINYPASDIPKQARQLFLTNRVRMLVDVNDELAMIQPPLHPTYKTPLYVGSCAARGFSPIHLEYLRNMKVRASLTVAIIEDDKLWGLIACHHYADKKIVSYRTRNLIRFMGQIISGHLSLFRAKEFREKLLDKNRIHSLLLEQMNEFQDVSKGLTEGKLNLVDYIESAGAAIYFEDKIKIVGETPKPEDITKIIAHLTNQDSLIYSTDSLVADFPDSASLTDKFAGLLSVKLSQDPAEYILWFRRSKTKKIVWGGNPEKAVVKKDNSVRLSPRKSFDKWKQEVVNQSESWGKYEKDAAVLLRNDIKEIILKRFNELKKIHSDLKSSYEELESFSYSVSHDLRSPLRAIEGFSQILKEDYSDKLDSYGMDVIDTIISSINRMNEFVNDILQLSKLAKVEMRYNKIDLNLLLPPLIEEFKNSKSDYKKVEVIVNENLPDLPGDHIMIKRLFSNLIGNAIKYCAGKEDPKVIIGSEIKNSEIVYFIKDNGIGMDENYINKIFDVFSRLVTEQEFEGTGIGLSIVKRIIERHQGKINIETELGEGSTFYVSFPKIEEENYYE